MRGLFLILGLGLLAALAALRWADPWPVQALREATFDVMQRQAPRPAPPDTPPVQVVVIDGTAQTGPWPWPRDDLARLVDRLARLGAAVVVLDLPLADPDRLSPARMADAFRGMGLLSPLASPLRLAALDTDLALANAVRAVPAVLGADPGVSDAALPAPATLERAEGLSADGVAPMPPMRAPLPVLGAAAAGLGVPLPGAAGPDGVVRRVPLAWRQDDGTLVPATATEALRLFLALDRVTLRGTPDRPDRPAVLRAGDLVVPLTARGEVWLRHPGAAPRPFLSAREVLAPGPDDALRAQIDGRIVLLGLPADAPAGGVRLAGGALVPRVAVQAQVIEQALARDPLRRDARADPAEVAALALLGVAGMAAMALGGAAWALGAWVIGGGAVAAGSWYALTEGALLVDATFPVLGALAVLLALMVFQRTAGDRDRRHLRAAFAGAVSPAALARIEAQRPAPALDGATRPVTVMVCDIRNFTPMTQGMAAPAVLSLLNRLFTVLGDEIRAEGGTVDRVVGDALLAFWNAPLDQPDHPLMAARAALRLRGALARFNARGAGGGQAPDGPHVSLAIGLGSGMGWVGRIGPAGRQGYGALGETVSQAARVETACRHVGYDILLGPETARRARDLAILDAGSLHVRGGGRIEMAILVGAESLAGSTAFRDLQACHLTLLRAIREDDAPRIAARLAECRGLAAAIEPGLRGFYDLLERRMDDYR